MSRSMLMLAGGQAAGLPGGGGGGDDGGGDGDPPPPPTAPILTYPATSDPIILAMRPTGRRLAAYSVDTTFPLSGTNFHTINDALTAGKAVQTAALAVSEFSLLGDPEGPDYRVDIFVAPGSYDEAFGTGTWCQNLIGVTGDPADVMISADGFGVDGVLHSFGSVYMEGMSFKCFTDVDSHSPKYPWHITGGQQMFMAHCVLDTGDSHTTGTTAGVCGMDGAPGATVIIHSCTFEGEGMNMHGSSPGAEPITWVFSQVNATAFDGTIVAGGPGAADARPDRVYVINCTGIDDIGTTATTHVYTNDDATITGTSLITTGVTVFPVPVAGMTDYWQAFFYPSNIGLANTQIFGAADQAAFSPPVGRHYWVHIIPTSAIHFQHHGVRAAAAGGVVGVLRNRVQNPPTTEGMGSQNLPTLVVGDNDIAYYYPNAYYPGETLHLFIQVQIVSGAPSLMGSLALAAGSYYSDDGGATILPVPGGSRVPVVLIRSATG